MIRYFQSLEGHESPVASAEIREDTVTLRLGEQAVSVRSRDEAEALCEAARYAFSVFSGSSRDEVAELLPPDSKIA